LQAAVHSLKAVESWDSLERVAVDRCDYLEYVAVSEVVDKKRLHYSS